jgi:hypothetical protein
LTSAFGQTITSAPPSETGQVDLKVLDPDRIRRSAARILRAVTPTYVLDGRQIRTLEDFWPVIGEAINGPGGHFGRNLDAFTDCLSGGFGCRRRLNLGSGSLSVPGPRRVTETAIMNGLAR